MTVFKFSRLVLPAAGARVMMAAPALAQTSGGSAVGAASQNSAAGAAKTSAAQSATAPAASGAGAGSAAGAGMSGVAAASKSKTMKLPAADAFKTVAAATAHCPGDTVVWSTLSKSKSYHTASSKYYGKTKHGAYVCEKDATAAGFHASKS